MNPTRTRLHTGACGGSSIAAGIRKAARQLEADRGKSYEQFWTTLHNSENAANKEAEALGLRD